MRGTIIAVVRGDATEADRLCLDQHLTTCCSCSSERARWLLMARLDQPARQGLSPEARARIVQHLTSIPEPELLGGRVGQRPLPMLSAPILWGGGAVALLVAVVLLAASYHRAAPASQHLTVAAKREMPAPELRRPMVLRDSRPGLLEVGRAHIAYVAGTELRVRPGEREVELVAGEIDVEVSPGGPGGFRVLTPRFTVQVIGTRFIVSLARVMTVHGVVQVREPDAAGGQQIAALSAGQVWRCPDEGARAEAAGQASSEPAGRASDRSYLTREARIGTAQPGGAAASSRSIDRLLSYARTALAAGDTARARRFLSSALRARPRARQRAMAELLAADALLVESRYDAALSAYRETLDRFSSYPEGETAAFALAELLSERGPPAQAEQALAYCLARYPKGRFTDEVEKKLASVRRAGGR
jgi:hypothetical protein